MPERRVPGRFVLISVRRERRVRRVKCDFNFSKVWDDFPVATRRSYFSFGFFLRAPGGYAVSDRCINLLPGAQLHVGDRAFRLVSMTKHRRVPRVRIDFSPWPLGFRERRVTEVKID